MSIISKERMSSLARIFGVLQGSNFENLVQKSPKNVFFEVFGVNYHLNIGTYGIFGISVKFPIRITHQIKKIICRASIVLNGIISTRSYVYLCDYNHFCKFSVKRNLESIPSPALTKRLDFLGQLE